MNVASRQLSKELYELSGWDATPNIYWRDSLSQPDVWFTDHAHNNPELQVFNVEHKLPAYDLGYLLRKLPDGVKLERQRRYMPSEDTSREQWVIEPGDLLQVTNGTETVRLPMGDLGDEYLPDLLADTPEDAAAKLAIELFKQGVLTRGGDE